MTPELKKGSPVTLPDGRQGTVENLFFDKVKIKFDSGMSQVFVKKDLWPDAPNVGPAVKADVPEPDHTPTDATVQEGTLNALLGIIGMGDDTAQAKFPGFHCVKCLKTGTYQGERSQAANYYGWGFKLLSEDPLVTGHQDMVIMGVPLEVWAKFEKALDEKTNGWRRNPVTKNGQREQRFEESEKMPLDKLTEAPGWSRPA